MNRRAPALLLFAIAAATIAGVAALYRARLDRGDGFAPYSSLRADPLGVRALHDALALLPGVTVTRRFEPLEDLAADPPRTIFLAGISESALESMPAEIFRALDTAALRGSRLVFALPASRKVDDAPPVSAAKPATPGTESGGKDGKPAVKKPAKPVVEEAIDPRKKWGFEVKHRWMLGDLHREAQAPAMLPQTLPGRSNTWFEPKAADAWHTLYRRGAEPVVLERARGRGSIVLMADAYPLSNEALQRDRATALLIWVVGPRRVVEFDESHLGVFEDHGVATLARSYGLGAAFVTFLVLALLFLWRNLAAFVPPRADAADVALSYNQTAGLEALLRRAVPAAKLAETCLVEWRRTARPADLPKAEAALAGAPKGARPADLYNAITRALRRR